jgi:hypothetical protein
MLIFFIFLLHMLALVVMTFINVDTFHILIAYMLVLVVMIFIDVDTCNIIFIDGNTCHFFCKC